MVIQFCAIIYSVADKQGYIEKVGRDTPDLKPVENARSSSLDEAGSPFPFREGDMSHQVPSNDYPSIIISKTWATKVPSSS